jgi:hypothetical protein
MGPDELTLDDGPARGFLPDGVLMITRVVIGVVFVGLFCLALFLIDRYLDIRNMVKAKDGVFTVRDFIRHLFA